MASYYERRTNMSRGQNTAEKKACTWRMEFFHFDEGLLESVSVFEDAFVYASPAHPFPVPRDAVASTAAAYAAATGLLSPDEQRRQRNAWQAAREKYPVLKPEPPLLYDFTVLDLEFQQENLLELAAIRYHNFEVVGEYVSFVQFRSPIWRTISELTGITALHVYDAPAEKEVLQQFKKLAGDSLLVCHNISADKRVLEAARTRQGATSELSNAWLDTLALARKRLPKGQKCGLADLCHHFSIKRRGEHRAKADVLMTVQVLRKLHELQPVTKHDLHGAPQPGKKNKNVLPAGPGLFAAA